MWNWLNENKDWFFSGGGIISLGWIGNYFFNKKEKTSQKIDSGSNSKNYQAGRDINIKKNGENNEK